MTAPTATASLYKRSWIDYRNGIRFAVACAREMLMTYHGNHLERLQAAITAAEVYCRKGFINATTVREDANAIYALAQQPGCLLNKAAISTTYAVAYALFTIAYVDADDPKKPAITVDLDVASAAQHAADIDKPAVEALFAEWIVRDAAGHAYDQLDDMHKDAIVAAIEAGFEKNIPSMVRAYIGGVS